MRSERKWTDGGKFKEDGHLAVKAYKRRLGRNNGKAN